MNLKKIYNQLLKEWKDEVFNLLHLKFSIDKAEEIIKEKKLKINALDVKIYAPQILGLIKDQFDNLIWTKKESDYAMKHGGIKITGGGQRVDLEHFMKTDPTKPGIMATYKNINILIDGNQRLAKCFKTGIKKFPVYLLNEEDTKKILL